jgi:hypothetical protein
MESCMAAIEPTTRSSLNTLTVGDRVRVVHEVKIGSKRWKTTTEGVVERVERRRQGLHFRRNVDDKVFSDLMVLRLDDGQLTTVTVDEFTAITRL